MVVQLFQAAASASVELGTRPNPAADRFFDAVVALGADDLAVFEDVIAQVERLVDASYDPMMVAAEAVAACLLRSEAYAPVVRGWSRREHPSARTAAVVVYSKAADVDPGVVDFATLAELVARLDGAPHDADEVTRMWLARLACKLRGTDGGAALIEDMATRGAPLRVAALLGIASDLSGEPPMHHLAVFRGMQVRRPSGDEPPRRLFWLLLELLYDPDPAVTQHAGLALQLVRASWPDLWNRLVSFQLDGPGERRRVARPGSAAAEFADNAEAAVATALTDLQTRTGREWMPEELRNLRARDLDRSTGGGPNPAGVDFAVRAPRAANARAGVLTWDPGLVEQDQAAEAAGEERLRIAGTPRLFLSYRWIQEVSASGAADAFAGSLFNRGYDIVFDRDPRHLGKRLSAGDVLLLLYGCTHFVLLETDELLEFLARPVRLRNSPIDLEVELARELAEQGRLVWQPVRLDRPFASDEDFPTRWFRVVATFADGHREGAEPVERRDVRATLASMRHVPNVVDVEVHDITAR
jgi:hypothetical protein